MIGVSIFSMKWRTRNVGLVKNEVSDTAGAPTGVGTPSGWLPRKSISASAEP